MSERVREYYWRDDLTCTVVVLRLLSEVFGVEVHPQVYDASLGLHGAGKYGAQCGLVEGGLLFIGILSGIHGFGKADVEAFCSEFAREFEERFGSLQCSVLRPQGFTPLNPPHLCERITCDAVELAIRFVGDIV